MRKFFREYPQRTLLKDIKANSGKPINLRTGTHLKDVFTGVYVVCKKGLN